MASGEPKRKKGSSLLDVKHSSRGVWLVKVPNYVSESWKKAKPHHELGRMRISKKTSRSQVQFLLAPELLNIEVIPGQTIELPKHHRVNTQDTKTQCMSVFSENQSNGEILIEGKVIQRADIQPVDSSVYMKLKKQQIQQAEKTKYTAEHLTSIPMTAYKPVSIHKEYESIERKKKELKKAREDKEVVIDLLFDAFERHQYYSFKDLCEITQQPDSYLKEILKEIGHYNYKAPHKNMWELKDEYRIKRQATSTNDSQ